MGRGHVWWPQPHVQDKENQWGKRPVQLRWDQEVHGVDRGHLGEMGGPVGERGEVPWVDMGVS